MEQGTEEWRAARLGKVTASRISEVMAKLKDGSYGASRANYMAEKILEKLTGQPQDGDYVSKAMQWGMDNEEDARIAYTFTTGRAITQVGFIEHPVIPQSGASPDGLVPHMGLVQIKCPNPATHIETLLTGKIDRAYMLQMNWEMACTETLWCDFVSFDPRMPPEMQLWIRRINRNDALIAEIRQEVVKFVIDCGEKLAALRKSYNMEVAA